jgi:hypothetical protein
VANYACGKIQERLRVLLADDPKPVLGAPNSCYADDHPAANAPIPPLPDVVFVIATAPNPVSTHLAVLFDRLIEAIEQSAQDNKYSYDSSWLPWNENKEYARYPDQLAAENSQTENAKQPGVLIFRKPREEKDNAPYKGGLVVFVVAELPTGGINQAQFDNALGWIAHLGRLKPDRELKILGPTFSGSLPSLYRELKSPQLRAYDGQQKIHVSSGTVSSDSTLRWFKERLEEDKLGQFNTALEGDCRVLSRFVKYITEQGYRAQHVAVVSEDETAFGTFGEDPANPNTPKHSGIENCTYSGDLTYLYYPRDIATLRSAYEQQSIFNAGKQPSNNTTASSTTLRGDLTEPGNSEHDTVRTYSENLTPLAQESVLIGITDVLKAKEIQFVVLRSTNSLDQIFISRFLRRSFPDARIVIDGADLLFRRGAEGAALRGVMALSTYPLLTWQQDWTSSDLGKKEGSYRIFGQDNAEGLYIAARKLLVPAGKTLDEVSNVKIANYAPPAWARSADQEDADNSRPATWLTVISRRQFWPVAVLNSFTLPKVQPASLLPTASDPIDKASIADDLKPMRDLPIEFWVLLIFGAIWGSVHFLWCKSGSISPMPAPFRVAYFAPVPGWQHPVLIGFGSWLVTAFAVIVAAASGWLKGELDHLNSVIIGGWALFVLLLGHFARVTNYQLHLETGVEAQSLKSRLTAEWSMFLLLLFMALHSLLILGLNTANAVPAFWRSVHLLSGVSPLLPQLLLLAGMYCWFWFSLRGLALFRDDRPVLPRKADLRLDGTDAMTTFSYEGAQEPIEKEALPIGARYFHAFKWICPGIVIVCAVVLRGPYLRTLGELPFGIYIFFWLTLCLALVLTDAAQCWFSWRRLRDLLVDLHRLPLRRTLYALQGLSWRSVWAMSGNVLMERYSLVSRQLESMRHLENRLKDPVVTHAMDARTRDELVQKIAEFQPKKLEELVKWYADLNTKPVSNKAKPVDVAALRAVQEEFASIAAMAAKKILIPSWRKEKDSLIFNRPKTKGMDEDHHTGPVLSDKIAPHVVAAEEFFVLPYVGFIQNILGRIRTTVLGSLFLFVATTLAVSSYTFDPLPVLGGIFLAVFLIVGSTMILIYAGMHRDATLSYITGSVPGELGGEFWRQLITFGVGPLLGLLTTLFPSITEFVLTWLQPSSQAIK